MKNLSLVVPCSRHEHTLNLLKSIESSFEAHPLEVFVVGNISEEIKKHNWSFKVHFIDEPRQHANIRRNIGIRLSQSTHIAFLDDDTEISQEWIKKSFHLIEKHPEHVFTGPEINLNSHQTSAWLYSICQSFWAELSKCHYISEEREVSWDEVPFCNCIVPKKYLEHGLSEDIPWDIDDFHFFSGIKTSAKFFNSPNLQIKHDRYPESLKDFYAYKWRLRKRTGINFVNHFSIYKNLSSVTMAALIPASLLALALVSLKLSLALFELMLLAYVFILIFFLIDSGHKLKGSVFSSLMILIGLHSISFLGLQSGIFSGLLQRLGRP